jgi:hypothetical protein
MIWDLDMCLKRKIKKTSSLSKRALLISQAKRPLAVLFTNRRRSFPATSPNRTISK